MKFAPKFQNFGRSRRNTHSYVLGSVDPLISYCYLYIFGLGQILQERAHVMTDVCQVTMISRFQPRQRFLNIVGFNWTCRQDIQRDTFPFHTQVQKLWFRSIGQHSPRNSVLQKFLAFLRIVTFRESKLLYFWGTQRREFSFCAS